VDLADEVFAWIERPAHSAVTSTVTLTELLVKPHRESNLELLDAIYGLLSFYPNLSWIPADLEIADLAARYRARHGMHTPDALQAATATRSRATGLITNDPVFARIGDFETLQFDSLLRVR
jgi:predicted nucleic acid-binding protein